MVRTYLSIYVITLFTLAAAAAPSDSALPSAALAKRARLASSVIETDDDTLEKHYLARFDISDAVHGSDFSGPLADAFEAAATKILGVDHGLSITLHKRMEEVQVMVQEEEEETPTFATYVVHQKSMLTPEQNEHGDYEEVQVPGLCGFPTSCDIPVDEVDAKAVRQAMHRTCLAFGMDKKGTAGWKIIINKGLR